MGRASRFTALALGMAGAATARAEYNSVLLYPLTPPSVTTQGIVAQSAAGGQVAGYGFDSSFNSHAIQWSTGSSVVDLTPSQFSNAFAVGTNGSQQVGYGSGDSTNGNDHALLWSGTALSAVDINPTGYDNSFAQAIAGNEQVGYAYGTNTNQNLHAMLWTGTADSAIDLNPTNYDQSIASGTDGVSQVGYAIGSTSTGGNDHAILWSGTADTAIDLNPAGYTSSIADSVSGTQQVGLAFGGADGHEHAFLWSGTAGSAVDLTPTNLTDITDSEAYGSNGSEQAGYGIDSDGNYHALLWSGTGASAVDLQALLSANGSWTDSIAFGIDPNGHVYGTADGTYGGVTGTFAIEWLNSAPILGDANLDGVINSADLAALMNGFANNLSGWSNGDFNGDGVVNADDLALFQLGAAAYNSGNPITVPEPGSLALIALGSLSMVRRRRI